MPGHPVGLYEDESPENPVTLDWALDQVGEIAGYGLLLFNAGFCWEEVAEVHRIVCLMLWLFHWNVELNPMVIVCSKCCQEREAEVATLPLFVELACTFDSKTPPPFHQQQSGRKNPRAIVILEALLAGWVFLLLASGADVELRLLVGSY